LTDEKYTIAAVKARNGMVSDALHPDGFLGYVQSIGMASEHSCLLAAKYTNYRVSSRMLGKIKEFYRKLSHCTLLIQILSTLQPI